MTSRAGLWGTDVNSALTSYDTITSSGPSVMPFRCSMKSCLLLMWCGDLPTSGLSILDKDPKIRTFGERFKEHQKAPSPIFDHHNTTGHNISVENFNIVGRVDQNLKRAIKEALYIRVNNPSLNRNVGKYHLPHIWDEVLFNIPET